MAATGATPISLYYSATTTNVPTAGNLVAGELALNTADGKLFYKDSGGVVQTLATKTAATFPNVNGATSGAVTLAAPAVAGSNTATFPAATGTVMVSGNMPAFSAYSAAAQNPTTDVYTKVVFGTESFDTNNNFASSRFTPTVAGYYQISASVSMAADTLANTTGLLMYKNGSASITNVGTYFTGFATASYLIPSVSGLVYLNGTTDYLEIYGVIAGTGALRYFFASSANYPTVFTGVLVRAA